MCEIYAILIFQCLIHYHKFKTRLQADSLTEEATFCYICYLDKLLCTEHTGMYLCMYIIPLKRINIS